MNELLELHKQNNNGTEPKDFRVSLEDVSDDIDKLRREGFRRGYPCGFNSLFEYYSVIPGKMTFITGSPDHGKTYFWFECLINLAQFHGLKHLVFTPEMGDPHEVYADLCGMVIGKKFEILDPKEMDVAKEFLNQHIFLIDPQDEIFTIEDWFSHAEKYKPDTLTGDPFNEFNHNFRDDYNRQDLYIERQLGFVRRKSKSLKIHTCIITHPRDQAFKEEDNIKYYPPPTAREYAGGQAWFRKGMAMLCVWRPPFGLSDNNNRKYEANETHIIIQKAKPRGVGKKGTVILYYDAEKARYYEDDKVNPVRWYGREIQQKEICPF